MKDNNDFIPVIKWIITVATIIIAGVAFAIMAIFPQRLINNVVGEFYSSKVFPVVSLIPGTFSNMFYFSLTEMVVVVGIVLGVSILIYLVIKLIQLLINKRFKKAAYGFLYFIKVIVVIALIVMTSFQMMHGINYRRPSVAAKFQIGADQRSYEEYCKALAWAYNGMVEARSHLGEDYNGVSHFQTNFETSVNDANGLLDSFSNYYGLNLSPNYVRAKPVMLSHLWRYTDIVGAYDMFLCEANINTDYMDITDTPLTICHEICHAKGYARETDCNMLSTLACIYSDRADFRYAGFTEIYFNIRMKVISIAQNLDYDYPSEIAIPSGILKDIKASWQYSEIFEEGLFAETVSEVSNNVNNSFLEANGQEGGVETYIVPTDVYVDYYFRYVE